MNARVTAIIVAAGEGRRMGGEDSKQFLELEGRPLFTWALLPFEAHPDVGEIIVVLPAARVEGWSRRLGEEFGFGKVAAVVPGGERRQDSVRAGLAAAAGAAAGDDLVAVHDGARPLLSIALLTRCLAAARGTGAAVPVIGVTDTLVRAGVGDTWAGTVDRTALRRVQTPQIFRAGLLIAAHESAGEAEASDDAQLVAALGHQVALVAGEEMNLKITDPADLAMAARLLAGEGRMG